MDTIKNAILAVHSAREEWMANDAVFAKLGEVLHHLRIAEKKAQKAIEDTYVLRQK